MAGNSLARADGWHFGDLFAGTIFYRVTAANADGVESDFAPVGKVVAPSVADALAIVLSAAPTRRHGHVVVP